MKLHNLRQRPFLVIETYYQPKRGVRTEKKGWGSYAQNWENVESPRIVNRISKNMLQQASVIIDLVNEAIIKNRYIKNEADEVLNHYKTKYAAQVNAAVNAYGVAA